MARLLISVALLLTLSVASPASKTPDSHHASARQVIANQPDFVADLIASDGTIAKRQMRLAKKGNLIRLDYADGTPTVFVDKRFSLWELDPKAATASPERTVPLICLHVPWLLLAFAADYPCVAFKETRDRLGRLVAVEIYVPGEDDSPMLCTVDRSGLVTRIEFSGYTKGDMGYRLYELKNVKYRVPSELFSVQLVPQAGGHLEDPCPPTGAT